MSAKVTLPPFLRHLTRGLATALVDGGTVSDCLADLVRQFPGLKDEFLNQDGELHEYIEIYVNGKTTYPMDLAKLIKEGDEILILNVIAGG
jgi:sulfur-carrier protein